MISPVSNLSAMQAFTVGQHGVGYNIANINTDGFRPVAVHYRSGPTDLTVEPVVTRQTAQLSDSLAVKEPSRTDLAREITHMIMNQRAFEANAVVVRTWGDTVGRFIDEFV